MDSAGAPAPNPASARHHYSQANRLVMVSEGVVTGGKGKAGLGIEGLIEAALQSESATAADTVRKVHTAVLDATAGDLDDDATVVCLSVS